MKSCKTILSFLLLLSVSSTSYGQSSVLHSGDWFKMAIAKEGVYRIDFNLLKKMGIDPGKIDPGKISIYGNEGGMLPQANYLPRPDDLQENTIFVQGEADGKFDQDDFILFYAQGADRSSFLSDRDVHHFEKNLYSDENFYFLTIGENNGKRITTNEDLGEGFPVISTFNDFVHHEDDKHNVLRSGREWFGEKFGLETTYTFPFTITGIVPGSLITVVTDAVSQSTTATSVKVSLNDYAVVEQKLLPISSTSYGVKGIHKRDTIRISATVVSADTRSMQELRYDFLKGEGTALAFLDFFLLGFERELALYDDQTVFTAKHSLNNPVSLFQVSNVPEDASVWDITDPYNVKSQAFRLNSQVASFATTTDQLKKFIVFNNKISVPVFRAKIQNQDLHNQAVPDLLIVTHAEFESEAQRLAAHRQSFSGWDVLVTTTDRVYNEFSSGRQDVSAIRDFVRHLRNKNPDKLKALLLFGKGSYDFKDRVGNNHNYVITYESRNSLHPLQTFSSDDYFAFLEDNEGNWSENPAENHTLDIGVGRLPVKTSEEAKNVVDKIIDYDTSNKSFGSWRQQISFVADDGNGEDGYTNLHQYQADQLAGQIETLPGADTRKMFMGAYPKVVKPNGTTTPKLTDDVIRAFEKGSLIINYTGHGSERQWGDENFFNDQTLQQLKNKVYPFLVTATCEFGRHDDPTFISTAEKCITAAAAGAVGMVTTARPVNATTNFDLNEAFYEALFARNGNSFRPVGEVFRETKNNSTSGVSNRNFSLLGDPSLTLALPPNLIVVTSVQTESGSDTLKALSMAVVRGTITNFAGETLHDFNGTLEATLYDKPTSTTTSGRNESFTFNQWSSVLFRGKASVQDGEFTVKFLLPKNMAYQVGNGKLSLYASDLKSHRDASGFVTNIKIGETETNVPTDNTAPTMQLYIGDTTFVNGGVAAPDTYLVARLEDNSGINISSYGFGNNIIAVLDDDAETFVLNDYYIADTDNHRAGWINYPLKELSPGKHRFTVKAWDVYNNYAVAVVDFMVTDGEALVIESLGNYPNPFVEKTTLYFTHNRSGDDLLAQVFIQKVTGEVIKTREMMLPACDYKVDLLELSSPDDNGKKLSAGLYLARVVIRSLTNGSKNEQVTKLIILN